MHATNLKVRLMRLKFVSLVMGIMLLVLIGCETGPKVGQAETNNAGPAKQKFEPQYVTGREALQKMYIQARSWAGDAKPYSLQSVATDQANGQDGRAGIWSAGFASPSRRGLKVYTWSGIQAEGAPEPGVGARPEDTYNPANTSTQIFDLAFLKTDSDEAVQEADKHGGDKPIKASPATKVFYMLEWAPRENRVFWHVMYGTDRNDLKLRVAIDASTGQFVKVEK